MDLSFITQMYIPLVVAGCLIIGYVMKKWINDVDNKWIPTVCCIAGAILACVAQGGSSIKIIIAGAVSGLASTGLHQVFKQLIDTESPKS